MAAISKISTVALVLFIIQATLSQKCRVGNTEEEVADLPGCLADIRTKIGDTSLFWFGTQYLQDCQNAQKQLNSIDCYNPLETTGQSIVSRIYPDGKFDPKLLDRFLNITFSSEKGEYSACGTIVMQNTPETFRIDPSASDQTRKVWFFRNAPTVTWTSGDEEQYTLLVVDVGYGKIHGFYINIPGSAHYMQGQRQRDYYVPANFASHPNPYAFLLFKQKSPSMQLLNRWATALEMTETFTIRNISDFQTSQDLIGPVAINWITVEFDPYGVDMANDERAMETMVQNCAAFVQNKLPSQNRWFFPSDTELKVWMKVTLHSPEIRVSACCIEKTYPQTTFTIDPLGEKVLSTAETRSGVSISLSLQMNKMYPKPSDLQGKMFTLVVLDPDVPRDAINPILHGLYTNIPEGRLQEGNPIQPFSGPGPPDKPHTYTFLLYEQPNAANSTLNNTDNYADNGRRRFNITEFVSDFNLELVGVSWFRSGPDYYYVERSKGRPDRNETEMCINIYGEKYCEIAAGFATCSRIELILAALFLFSSLYII